MAKQNTQESTKKSFWKSFREIFEGPNGRLSSKRIMGYVIIVPVVIATVVAMFVTMFKEIHIDWLIPVLMELVPAGIVSIGITVAEKQAINEGKNVNESNS